MKTPDLKSGQMITIAYLVGLLVVLFIVYKLLIKVGLIKSPAKKRAQAEAEAAVEMLRTDDYFSPDYYKGRQFKSLGSNQANLFAQQIRKALRGFGTNEEELYTTFSKLYNKCNVSEVAESYQLQYKNNLQADLLNDLNDKEVAELMNIINGLPAR